MNPSDSRPASRLRHPVKGARLLRLAALAASGLCGAAAIAAPPLVPPDVKASVQKRVDYGFTPGMVVGMVNADGRATWSYGARSWDDPTPPDSTTIYEIASVTKTFTAVLLAQMEEAGEVGFDDLASDYLPPGTTMPSNGGDAITLEHLAAQRSGLPTLIPAPECVFIDPANSFAEYSADWIYGFLAEFELPRAPGTAFEYSNLGIGLLGQTLAQSQDVSYEALLKERVIDPLGMSDTAITLTPAQEARRAPGHGGYIERPRFEMNDLSPAGALCSTVDDLLTYLEHNMGLVAGSPLHAAMAETHLSRGSQPSIGGVSMQAGLVWWLWDLGGGVVQHGGDAVGSAAFLGFRPSTGVGAVVLSNARRHGNSEVRDLGMRCIGAAPGTFPTTAPATVPLAEKMNYVGRYAIGGEELAVGLVNEELTLLANGIEVTIYPEGGRRFVYLDAGGGAELSFAVDDTGAATGMTLEQFGSSFPFTRVTGAPVLKIARDCDDMVVRLMGEPEQSYTLETSVNGEAWTSLGPWTMRMPPHRESIGQGSHLFRVAPGSE